jgi:hypothetical protein
MLEKRALKARINAAWFDVHGMNRAFSADEIFLARIPGALPQAHMNTAPLALKRCSVAADPTTIAQLFPRSAKRGCSPASFMGEVMQTHLAFPPRGITSSIKIGVSSRLRGGTPTKTGNVVGRLCQTPTF